LKNIFNNLVNNDKLRKVLKKTAKLEVLKDFFGKEINFNFQDIEDFAFILKNKNEFGKALSEKVLDPLIDRLYMTLPPELKNEGANLTLEKLSTIALYIFLIITSLLIKFPLIPLINKAVTKKFFTRIFAAIGVIILVHIIYLLIIPSLFKIDPELSKIIENIIDGILPAIIIFSLDFD